MKVLYKIPRISEIAAPFLPIKIFDDTHNYSHPKKGTVDALIDTGYDGFIIVPLNLFDELKLISSEIPRDQVPVAETIVGEYLELRTALGFVEIPDLSLSKHIEIDTYPNCTEILIGRQFLEFMILTLNGPEKSLLVE